MKTFFRKANYILYSIRPSACLMVGVFVLVAFRPSLAEAETAFKLFVSAFTGSAFCFLLNDIYDRKKDMLNNKSRPLATGKLSVIEAYVGALIFVAIYLVSSFLLGNTVFALAWLSIFFFAIYSPTNSRGGITANIIVAICASGSVWGVAIVRNFDPSLFYISGLIFLMIIIREILLDWLDIEGDEMVGKPSIPIMVGLKKTVWIMAITLSIVSILVFTAPIMVLISDLSMIFLVLSLIASWIPLIKLFKETTDKNVLFNIRFSHVTFVFIVLGILFR